MSIFQVADKKIWAVMFNVLLFASSISLATFILIFFLWSRFGNNLKSEQTKEGSGVVLTDQQVRSKLRSIGKASKFHIGKMPLVKDTETRHFLVAGCTGSGKTNLIDNLLPQIEAKGQQAIIIDQTGEMISKYYNSDRGDIIFNPFDARGKGWDFWTDCSTPEELERFSKILFSFNRKRSGTHSDPFWEQSAETVFNSCVEYLVNSNNTSIRMLKRMVQDANLAYLQKTLKGMPADRYLSDDGKGVATSVLAMLASSSKPISYLTDDTPAGKFSLKDYFQGVKTNSKAWLFLSTKPSSRDLTLPLIACLTELALTQLMDIGINKTRRVWCIFDELPALGNLPALSPLMAEGRKYGACVLAGLQSLNQLYDNYGQYAGSAIFGQFGTSFFFRNKEPAIAKMFSSMCGTETITRQQKNTSFGANEFRDGVSYNEMQQRKALVEYSDIASLNIGECYTLLPEPLVNISKMQVPEAKLPNKNEGFIPKTIAQEEESTTIELEINETAIDNNHQQTSKMASRQKKTEHNIEIVPNIGF
jgi:type IV conjugative transfer system coupling protein TraD